MKADSDDPSKYFLSFSKLSFTVKTKNGIKRLTDDVSVEIQGGEMVGES
jgi:ABC-type dipeptide/oligopeptide/nickel transport system ATPase component